MPIPVSCPSCGKEYNVKDAAAGKKFKCKDCEAVVDVPAAGGGQADEYGDPFGDADPFGDLDFGQPEAAGAPVPRRRSSGKRRSSSGAGDRTKLPAIFLYVVCVLSIGYSLLSIVAQLAGLEPPGGGFANQQQQMGEEIGRIIGFVLLFVFLLRDGFIIFAAWQMQSLGSYGIAMTGAILSVIPCLGSPCCILGIPFGIWALVVLNDDAVKAAFR